MKKLLFSVLLLTGCQGAPVVPEPQPAVPVGFTFTTPCEVHGEDTWTVNSAERVFVYSFTNTEGIEARSDEKGLLEVFAQLGISVDKK